MKLGINEIKEGIYISAINRISKQLKQEGFKVYQDYYINDNVKVYFDIYAEKGHDKRIYELKIGKNKIQENQFLYLQNQARNMKARLFVIYLEIPESKHIFFDGIENIIKNDFKNHVPQELLLISNDIEIVEINTIDINSLSIEGDIVKLRGTGVVFIDAYFIINGKEYKEKYDFDFTFRLTLDQYERTIIKAYYKIDTSYIHY